MYLIFAGTTLVLGSLSIACAQSMEALSYTNAPNALDFLTTGYADQSGNVRVDPSWPIRNVKATVDIVFLAYRRDIDFWR